MKIGLLGTSASPGDALEMAVLAEALGFDGFFLPEHHQEPHWPSAPLVTLAAVAGRTRRLRLGTAVTVMALHNPVRLAEEAATLDVLSGGRFVLGIGMGYIARDFAALGVPAGNRLSLLEEGMEVLGRAWTQRPFTFQGRRFRFRQVSAYPAPVQRPHPPLWLAAWTEAGVRRAAALADGWLTDPVHGLEAIRRLAEEYRRAAREAGREPFVVLMRQFALAGTDEEAWRLYGEQVAAVWRYYWHSGSFNLRLEPRWAEIDDPGGISARMVVPDRVPLGGPDRCLADLRRWAEAVRPDYLIVAPTPSPHGAAGVMEMVRLFGEAVLPRLAA